MNFWGPARTQPSSHHLEWRLHKPTGYQYIYIYVCICMYIYILYIPKSLYIYIIYIILYIYIYIILYIYIIYQWTQLMARIFGTHYQNHKYLFWKHLQLTKPGNHSWSPSDQVEVGWLSVQLLIRFVAHLFMIQPHDQGALGAPHTSPYIQFDSVSSRDFQPFKISDCTVPGWMNDHHQ